jgi:hypothetical protein
VLQQDTPDFPNGLGLILTGVISTHHLLRNHLINMGALVSNQAVIAIFLGAVTLDCARIWGETGIEASIFSPGLFGFILSIEVGGQRSIAVNFSSPVDVAACAIPLSMVWGSVTSLAARLVTHCWAVRIAPC